MRASATGQSSPPRRVAEVTSTPSAGAITVAASGRVGSSQRRWMATSYSRPSIRSTASQSTNSGSASPPIRPSKAIHAASVSRRQARPRIAPSTRARAAASSQSGASSSTASSRRASAASGFCSASSALRRRMRRRHQSAVGLGQLGLEPVARFLRLGPGVDHAADFGEQGLDRAERRALDQPLQPAVRRQGLGRLDGRVERAIAFLVVRRDVHQSRGEPAPASARAAFRADDPAPHLDRFLSAERDREGRIRRRRTDDGPRRTGSAPAHPRGRGRR